MRRFLRVLATRRASGSGGERIGGEEGRVQEMCPDIVGQQVGRSTSRSAWKVGSAAGTAAAVVAVMQLRSGQKKEEGPVVWPDPPDPSTPGPDSRFGAGQRQGIGQAGASASLPLILPKDFRPRDIHPWPGIRCDRSSCDL